MKTVPCGVLGRIVWATIVAIMMILMIASDCL